LFFYLSHTLWMLSWMFEISVLVYSCHSTILKVSLMTQIVSNYVLCHLSWKIHS
jgi:hypothetical protein